MARSTTGTTPNLPAIAGISYVFPERSRTVRQMADDGLLESSAETMESFGFARVHVAVAESPYELALSAARSLLTENEIDPASIGLVIYGGTPGRSEERRVGKECRTRWSPSCLTEESRL